jgi:hypothetical protein
MLYRVHLTVNETHVQKHVFVFLLLIVTVSYSMMRQRIL